MTSCFLIGPCCVETKTYTLPLEITGTLFVSPELKIIPASLETTPITCESYGVVESTAPLSVDERMLPSFTLGSFTATICATPSVAAPSTPWDVPPDVLVGEAVVLGGVALCAKAKGIKDARNKMQTTSRVRNFIRRIIL